MIGIIVKIAIVCVLEFLTPFDIHLLCINFHLGTLAHIIRHYFIDTFLQHIVSYNELF